MNRHALAGSLVLAAALVTIAPAQPAPPKPEKVDFKLENFEKTPKLKAGKVKLAEGSATADPDRFFVENLEIVQPVAVTVLTKDPAHDVKLQLSKWDWDKGFDREGSTKGKTSVTFKVRTQGDLKIIVSSPDAEPRPYQLIVWVGDPMNPPLKAVAVKKSAYKAPAGGKKPPTMGVDPNKVSGGGNTGIIIAIVLVGLVIVTTLVVLNRRKR